MSELESKKKRLREVEKRLEDAVSKEIVRKGTERKLRFVKRKAGEFKVIELISDMVDLVYALYALKGVEFKYVDKVFVAITESYGEKELDFSEYDKLHREIAIDFDMVAPYYKMCREGCPIVSYNDTGKEEFREKARRLVDEEKLFSEQWYKLKEEFCSKFYGRK